MPNGDCPVGADHGARLRILEREMGEVKAEQHEVRDAIQQLLTDAAVRTAELDARSKAAVAWIAGSFTLLGVVVNALIVYTAR